MSCEFVSSTFDGGSTGGLVSAPHVVEGKEARKTSETTKQRAKRVRQFIVRSGMKKEKRR